MKQLLRILMLGYVLAGLPACAKPLTYSAEPIEAWVIDAATKKPLEGVVVTANWQLEEGTLGGNVQVGQLMVLEAVTDKSGRFYFPAWGPLKVAKGHLVSEDPQLLIFKSGYQSLRLSNQYTSDRELRLRPVRRSDWNGKTIEMKSFRGTSEEYARHLSFLHTGINSIFYRDKCAWKKIPRMVVALDKQETFFRNAKIYSSLYSINDLPNNECGSPKELLREFML
mgnify:CR=1 FL=1